MQVIRVAVYPIEMNLQLPVRMAGLPAIDRVNAVFVRLETRKGQSAWGCAVSHPELTGDHPEELLRVCHACADLIPDLPPTNLEYTLAELTPLVEKAPGALCAFDLALHDLLGIATGMPLYRLLGGYRNRIQTSATIPLGPVDESVDIATMRIRAGFRMLKVKGGLHPDEDVRRVRAIHRAYPDIRLRLDADGGYTVQQALDVARALEGRLEMVEQPTPPDDLEALRRVRHNSPIPVLADQSLAGPSTALDLASHRCADGLCIKLATCGGLRCARQIDAIARAAGMATMVSCLPEPALIIAAGLSFALSSPNVHYGDLDGHLDLVGDPTVPGFHLEEGWLVATDIPGLGCSVELG